MDPLGLAYVSITYNSLFPFGGETVNSHEFHKLMSKVNSLKETYPFKVVVGGRQPGRSISPAFRLLLGSTLSLLEGRMRR